jgi:hypothetical protein
MERKGKLSEVKRGFRTAGLWLFVMGWLGLVVGGMAIAFTPSPHSRLTGWVMIAVAAIILVATMDKWVGVLSALLAYGTFGGILTIAGGHAVNHPEVKVPRVEGVVMTVLIAAGAMASFTFTKRRLYLLDRIALFVFVFCFFWGAAAPRLALLALGIGVGWLAAAWAYDRIWRRRDPDRRRGPAVDRLRRNAAR